MLLARQYAAMLWLSFADALAHVALLDERSSAMLWVTLATSDVVVERPQSGAAPTIGRATHEGSRDVRTIVEMTVGVVSLLSSEKVSEE
tara:strand:+ start:2437 stop:2703 length:267 start_codon:yes stop_codon:yes gene_type:complete